MAEIGRVVYMSHFIIAAVRMDMAGEIVVKVNGPTQHYCGLRHEASRRRRLRHGNHRSLL